MKKIPLTLVALVVFLSSYAQSDRIGSGRAILFDGVDDYIDLGNIYDDLALPMTISAWVYVEPASGVTQYPIFDSQDNSSIYNGFTFVCSTLPHIGFTIGDGQGGNNPAFRRSRAGYFQELGKWVYMTAVAKSGYDIHTFLNGHDVSGEYQGTSSLPMNSNSPAEVAKIGYLFSNGLVFRFKGIMDEVRIWNRALTEQEIRESMCRRLTKTEPGLIGHWDFDETGGDIVFDQSTKGFNGTLKGNPQRVYSGAPVGDESTVLYTSSWTGKELTHNNVRVSNIQGTPFGAHIYSVNHVPSQTGGLSGQTVQPPYHGIFLADDSGANSFDFAFTDIDAACGSYQRKDNSVSTWTSSGDFTGVLARTEVIPIFVTADFKVDLGPDAGLCDHSNYTLETNIASTGRSFTWNTGETAASIVVTSSGKYAVEVTDGCKVDRDTVEVIFRHSPPQFSLGEDEELCDFNPRILAVDPETNEYAITWHDGTSEEQFLAEDFGTYWVKIENACGVAYDSITFKEVRSDISPQYNFISPGNYDDRNQYFVLNGSLSGLHLRVFNRWGKEVFHSPQYNNRWDGGDLPAGVYFYTIDGQCIESYKGTLTIMR